MMTPKPDGPTLSILRAVLLNPNCRSDNLNDVPGVKGNAATYVSEQVSQSRLRRDKKGRLNCTMKGAEYLEKHTVANVSGSNGNLYQA